MQATGGNARIWVKKGIGPHYGFEYEGCADKADVALNPGGLTPVTCESEAEYRKTKVIDIAEEAAGAPTTTISVLWSQARWLMEQARACPMIVDLRMGFCSRPDDPTGWDSIFRFNNARVQPSNITNLASLTDAVKVQANVTGETYIAVYDLELGAIAVDSPNPPFDAVLVVPEAECAGDCGPGREICSIVYIASEGEYLSTAEVYKSVDGGGVFTAMATSPFAAGESISAMVGDDTRLVVSRGSTDAGNPAEVAITEDAGVTWAYVDVGTTNGEFITCMFRRGRKIWAGTSAGYLYFSSDYGNTWSAQNEAAIAATRINHICMYSDTVGMAVYNTDHVAVTVNGSTWTAGGDVVNGSNPNLTAVWMVTQWIAFVGTANGTLYYTLDRGTTWTLLWTGPSAPITDIQFADTENGYLLCNGDVYRTTDGGGTWTAESTPTAAVLRDLDLCTANRFWAVGQTAANVGVAVLGQPVPETPV